MSPLTEIMPCPKCGGTGHLRMDIHEHQWRLVMSMGGPGFNLQRYVCTFDGCEATVCTDCIAAGRETCQTIDGDAA